MDKGGLQTVPLQMYVQTKLARIMLLIIYLVVKFVMPGKGIGQIQ